MSIVSSTMQTMQVNVLIFQIKIKKEYISKPQKTSGIWRRAI